MSQNDKDSKKQVPGEAESGEMKKEGAPVAKGGKKDPKEEELVRNIRDNLSLKIVRRRPATQGEVRASQRKIK